jgi:hypothetical protein
MRIALKLILWPIVCWSKSTRLFFRIIDQAVDLGASPACLVTEWRYYKRWKASLDPAAAPVEARHPWLTFRAIDRLADFAKPGCQVFEWGVGGSSLFFIDRGARVITVEHDRTWFELLTVKMQGATAWSGRLILPEVRTPASPCDPSDPAGYGTSDEQLKDFDFKSYARSILDHPDESFDVVCVDGRSRPACLAHSRGKVRRGGLLVLDNAERETYGRAMALCRDGFVILLDAPGSVPSCRWPSRTQIWKKL